MFDICTIRTKLSFCFSLGISNLIFRNVHQLMIGFKVVWIHSQLKSILFQNQDAKLQ